MLAACVPVFAACGDDPSAPTDTTADTSTDTLDSSDAPDSTDPDTVDADTIEADTLPPVDTTPAPVGRLVINEVDCRSDPIEWVEVVNVGNLAMSLDGFRVTDKPSSRGVAAPAGVMVQPGGHAVVRGDIGISCTTDGVYLIGPSGIVDQAPPRKGDPELATWGRVPDGSGPFALTVATPQKTNRALDDLRASIFVQEGPVPTIDLYVDAAAEDTLRSQQKVYAPAIFQWTDSTGTSAPQRIDLRIKGSITLRPWDAKPSLKLHFARHEEAGPRSFRGAKKVTLHNMSYDPSTVREWLSYEVMRARGQPAPRVGWVNLRVNGVSKHLYAIVESYDEVFLGDWFPSTKALYECDGDLGWGGFGGITLDEGDSMVPLETIADKANRAFTEGRPGTRAMPEVDWVQLAGMMGLEDLLQHTDGMRSGCHNFFMHVDQTGRWSFMPWSVDLTLLAGYGSTGPLQSCSLFARLCDADEVCVAWFERARDEAAQLVLRKDFRTRAVALAQRTQAVAWAGDEPWGGGDFWGSKDFDLVAQTNAAVDLMEARARAIRCTTGAKRTDPPTPPEDNPTCDGFLYPNPGGPK